MTTPVPQPDAASQALADALSVSFRVLRGLMALVVVAYLLSGIFVVQQHERALVLRLGKLTGIGADRALDPGLHWTWPRPFSEIVRIPAERVQTLDSQTFWHARAPVLQDTESFEPTLRPERDGYLVSGDANLLHSRWALRFTITDPVAYHLRFADAQDTLKAELDRAVLHATARFPIDRALRTDLESLRDTVEQTLRARADAMSAGIRVQGVDLLAIAPPRQIAEAFDAVTEAAQERAQQISDARAYSVRTLNGAEGDAARIRSEGEAKRLARETDVASRADVFERIHPKWLANPDVIARTIWQDTVRRAIENADERFVVHGTGDAREVRLHLGPQPLLTPESLK